MDTEALIVDNIGLVYHMLHKFNKAYDDEAFSYAMEALMKAAITFDESKHIKFSTYASVCIYNGINYYMRKLYREDNIEIVSMEAPISDNPDLTVADTICSEDTPERTLLRSELNTVVRDAIAKVLSETTNRKAVEAIEYWRSTDFTASQCEIAKYVGVAQPTVSRFISVFKYKMKLELEGYYE